RSGCPSRRWCARRCRHAQRYRIAGQLRSRRRGHDRLRLVQADYVADYVVVGTGSAGSVVANRLSANPDVEVVVLEAGPPDVDKLIHIPAAFSKLFRSAVDWDYLTEPQPQLGGRRIYWPRGKTLGGSSSMNAMMWVRGFAADCGEWLQH